MRALVASVVLLVALATAGCTPVPAPQSIVGSWESAVAARDDPDWRGVIGNWKIEYRPDGQMIVSEVGGMNGHAGGTYRFDGDILTANDLTPAGPTSCRVDGVDNASAVYRIRFVDQGMRAEVLRDECPGRVSVMTNRLWRRIR